MKPSSPRGSISLSLCLLLLAGTDVHAGKGGGHGGHGGRSKHTGHAARGNTGVAPSHAYARGVAAVRPAATVPSRTGYWAQGVRGGYSGWWWVAGPAWYLYPAPAYPYPVGVSDTVIVDPGVAYYCGELQAFFPDVNSCPGPWTTVTPGAPVAAN